MTPPVEAVAVAEPLLCLDALDVYYGKMQVLRGVAIEVGKGELICLLGGNASGKSTTLRTVLGLVRPRRGRVRLDGEDVTDLPTGARVARGVAIVPENRRLFPPLSVRENLEMGLYLRPRGSVKAAFERVLCLFPALRDRMSQMAGTLSGGEQQMVAIARALMSEPRVLLMDEPSMGLAPALVERSFEIIEDVHRTGVSILVVEQNANMALSVADRGYVLQMGEIVLSGPASMLRENEQLKKAYLGR
ncbi:MAG: ABC transporter ATP-binding protein [Acidimicrobiales bacterium]